MAWQRARHIDTQAKEMVHGQRARNTSDVRNPTKVL